MKDFKKFIPALLWMGFIFLMSSMTGDESSLQSNFIIDIIYAMLPLDIKYIDIVSFIVRKCAHMSEYAILVILLYYGFYNNAYDYLTLPYLISVLYAVSDELHQLFVGGRAGQFVDVCIDSTGALIGLLLIILFKKYYFKKRSS